LILEEVLDGRGRAQALRGRPGGAPRAHDDDGLGRGCRPTLSAPPGKRPSSSSVARRGRPRAARARGQDLRVEISASLAEAVDALLGRGRVRLARI
jgi:hypothetical protein